MEHILIVEDDIALAQGLCRALASSEVQTESCGTLAEASRRLAEWEEEEQPLLLLDVNLPDGNGFDFLKTVKEAWHVSVIMLTANDMEMDIVAGLEQGAEDYITKPFSLAVLRARVAAVMRRRQRELPEREGRKTQEGALSNGLQGYMTAPAENGENTSLKKGNYDALYKEKCVTKDRPAAGGEQNGSHMVFDGYDLDFEKMLFAVNGQAVELSKTEQKLLRIFMSNRGITMSRDTLIDRIWTDGAEYVDENALSVAVKRLRDKLSAQQYIKTVYGVGYLWKKERQEPDE